MAKTAVLNVRIDPKVKAEAEKLYSQFGITVTDAINMFLYQSINEGGLPFELKKHIPNSETLSAMREAEEIAKNGGRFDNVDEMFKEMGI